MDDYFQQSEFTLDVWQSNGERNPYSEISIFLSKVAHQTSTINPNNYDTDLPFEDELERLITQSRRWNNRVDMYSVEETIEKDVSADTQTALDLLLGNRLGEYEITMDKHVYVVPTEDGVALGGDEELVRHCRNVMKSRQPNLSGMKEVAKIRGKKWWKTANSLLESKK